MALLGNPGLFRFMKKNIEDDYQCEYSFRYICDSRIQDKMSDEISDLSF